MKKSIVNIRPTPVKTVKKKKKEAPDESIRTPRTSKIGVKGGSSDEFNATTMLRTIYVCTILGANYKEIAAALGIAEQTYYDWRKRYPEIQDMEREGGILAEARVAEALYKRAIGFTHVDVTRVKDELTGKIKVNKTKRYYPPDVQAAFTLLKNKRIDHTPKEKRPDQATVWKDKQEKDITSGGLPLQNNDERAKETLKMMLLELGEE